MPERVVVEVLAPKDCPAADDTIRQLKELGLEFTVKHMDRHAHDFWTRRGYPLEPVVMVYIGEGERRVRYFTWDGNRPHMLKLTHKLATVGQ